MTKKAAVTTTKSPDVQAQFTLGAIGLTFLDTTWRIAVPVSLLTALGIFVDLRIGTKPWLTFAGVIVGFVFAVLLVRRQLAAVQKEDDK